jgi:hypothetical protein
VLVSLLLTRGAESLPTAMLDLDPRRIVADDSEQDLDLGPLGRIPAEMP